MDIMYYIRYSRFWLNAPDNEDFEGINVSTTGFFGRQ